MTATVWPDRVETERRDDGTVIERVYLDGKLVARKVTPPPGIAPRSHPRSPTPPESKAI